MTTPEPPMPEDWFTLYRHLKTLKVAELRPLAKGAPDLKMMRRADLVDYLICHQPQRIRDHAAGVRDGLPTIPREQREAIADSLSVLNRERPSAYSDREHAENIVAAAKIILTFLKDESAR